jgi:hypothetical protein
MKQTMEFKEKHKVMFIKEWLALRPQFRQLYCPDTFVPMARRLCDGKDFKLYSIIPDNLYGEEMYIEHLDVDRIHVHFSINDKITGNWKASGVIEINELP